MANISIIIPCYNAQQYILNCLNSFLNQTFKDFDIILIDDCSSDNTIEVVQNWKEQHQFHLSIIVNEVNLGPSKSRFIGASASTSEWLAFCDSDDWYETTFLHDMLYKANVDNCDIVFCGYQNIIGNKKDIHLLKTISHTLSPKEAMSLNVDSLCMSIIKRSIFVSIPHLDVRYGEDMALIPLLICNSQRIGIISEALYNYNIRPGSASLSPSEIMIKSLIKSFSHINTYADNTYFDEKEYLGIRNLIYGSLLNLFKYSYNVSFANSILDDFEVDYPNWYCNKYINKLPYFKQLYILCAKNRFFFMLFILSKIHSLMLRL